MEEDHHGLGAVGCAVVGSPFLHSGELSGDFIHKLFRAEGLGQGQGFFLGFVVRNGRTFAGIVHIHTGISKLLAVGFFLVAAYNDQIRLIGQHGFNVQAAHAGRNRRQFQHPVRIFNGAGRRGHRHRVNVAAHQNLQCCIGQAHDAFRLLSQCQGLPFAFLKVAGIIKHHAAVRRFLCTCKGGKGEHHGNREDHRNQLFQHTS